VFFRDGDGSVHLFINISPDGGSTYSPTPNMRSYVIQPASADWTQWTTPTLLQLPSINTNEFFCWKEGSIYHGVYVDFNAGGGWQHVTSTNMITGWSAPTFLSYNASEGGFMLKNPGGGYRFFCEANAGYTTSELNEPLTHILSYPTPVTADVPMKNGKAMAALGATTYTAWAAANTPSDTVPLDSPAGDGICNLLKCALGLAPLQPESAALPAPQSISDNGTEYLRLQYIRYPQFLNLSASLQTSSDLTTWKACPPISITLMSDGTELVEGRVSLSNGAQFLRIQATQQ
jgi:hypothetical protein